jgi:hypothetical protein
MRRLLVSTGLAAGLLALGACATLGEPVTLNLAELTTRCEDRGGVLVPTGAETGRAQSDFICREAMARTGVGGRNQARTDLDRAIGAGLQRGGPYGRSN